MTEISTSSITIEAPASEVRQVLFDIAAYPEWSTSIKNVEVVEVDDAARPIKVHVKVEAGMLKDRATLIYDWSAAPEELSFHLEDADVMTEMSGRYQIIDNQDESTTVSYSLTVALSMPVPDMMRKKAELSTIELSLKQLKQKFEE
jgi:uncharacterized membrane protein